MLDRRVADGVARRGGGVSGVPVEVRAFTFTVKDRDPGPYTCAKVDIGRRQVEITVSPTERTIHIHVDGVIWKPAA